MSTLGKRIRYIRTEVLEINQTSFAEKLGFSRTATISDYEKDKRNPDIDTLRKIGDISGVALGWLLTGEGAVSIYDRSEPAGAEDAGKTLYSGDFAKLEVYAMAGDGRRFPAGEPVDTVFVPMREHNESTVAALVKGESMSPVIVDGAIVGVDKTDRHVVNGRLYAVWLDYEGMSIKRVFVYPDRIVLKSDNPGFPETNIPNVVNAPGGLGADFIVGRVKWVFQRY